MEKFFKLLLLTVVLISLESCSKDDGATSETDPDIVSNPDPDPDPDPASILDYLTENSDYSLLLGALEKVGLDTALGNSGTYTLFAPNNAAFTAYLDGATLDDISDSDLIQLLNNHVLETTFLSTDLVTGYVSTRATEITDNSNISMHVNTTSGVVLNGYGMVTEADITKNNGVIHAVNQVLFLPDLITLVRADPNLAEFEATLDSSSLNYDLLWSWDIDNGAPAPFTLFAPINSAFDGVTLPDDNTLLNHVIVHHLVTANNMRSSDFVSGTITTNRGDATLDAAAPSIQGGLNQTASNITVVDIQATNGVIHTIDQILQPAPQ